MTSECEIGWRRVDYFLRGMLVDLCTKIYTCKEEVTSWKSGGKLLIPKQIWSCAKPPFLSLRQCHKENTIIYKSLSKPSKQKVTLG